MATLANLNKRELLIIILHHSTIDCTVSGIFIAVSMAGVVSLEFKPRKNVIV